MSESFLFATVAVCVSLFATAIITFWVKFCVDRSLNGFIILSPIMIALWLIVGFSGVTWK